jgi:hypothetical protein
MRLGDRINTIYGWGTITGFERFSSVVRSMAIDAHRYGEQRVVVALDDPARWVGRKYTTQRHPFMWGNDLSITPDMLPDPPQLTPPAVHTPALNMMNDISKLPRPRDAALILTPPPKAPKIALITSTPGYWGRLWMAIKGEI